MFDLLTTTQSALQGLAREFEPRTLTGEQAVRAVEQLGLIHRLTAGLLAQAAKRVADTSAHERSGDRDAAQFYARAVGVEASEARRVIDTAKRLEQLPETAAAVREGQLSARQAHLVAETAASDPRLEGELLAAAREGMVPLKDACLVTRARAENETVRAARQHAARRFHMWTAGDGMVEGRFRLTPEVGGQLKAKVDAGAQRRFRSRRVAGPHEALGAYAADALTELVLSGQGTAKGIAVAVHVLVDHAALVRGNAIAGETCEIAGVGPVNVAWVRSVFGEAFITAVVKKGRDITTVAHVGRHVRAELKTALIAGGRECEIVGCHARGYLERDHCEVDYSKGGPTAWWNLAWLCSVHHCRKTRGWKLGPRDPERGKRRLERPDLVPAGPPARGSPQE